MFEERVGRFSTVTRYRELFSKEIFQIELCLIEVRLMNHSQNLFATGTVKRQIQYIELGEALRKIEDQIQFTVSIGRSFEGPLSDLQTDLSQEYFVLQPSPKNAHFAVLEQGFLLNVKPFTQVEQAPQYNKIKVNSVTNQGKDSTVIQIPYRLATPGGQLQSFTGKAKFTDLSALPIAVAEIEGTINKALDKNFFKEKVSLLVNVPTPNRDQKLTLYGDIQEADWQSDAVDEWGGIMTLRLDYRWYLTTFRELLCLKPSSGDTLPIEQIETLMLKDRGSFHFLKSFQVEMPNAKELIEIKLEEFHYENYGTKKGILLHADLILGITFINLDGVEQYQECPTFIDELFSGFISKSPHSIIEAVLESKIVESAIRSHHLNIILDFQYEPQIYQKQVTAIVRDDSSSEVIEAKALSGEKIYSFSVNENLPLKFHPLRIIKVLGRVLEITGTAHEGWVAIQGVIAINIRYVDHQRQNREDHFQRIFQNFYIWGQVKAEMELEFVCELEYEHFQLTDININYQCLLKAVMKAFHRKRIGVKIAAELPQLPPLASIDPKENVDFSTNFKDLGLDWNLPLMKGGLQEIAKSEVQISQFNYQYSENAILIKGCLTGEIEYWDQKQYLQKLSLELPFWRFIPNDEHVQFTNRKLLPEIHNCSYQPLQTVPWRKRRLKIHLDLGLCTI